MATVITAYKFSGAHLDWQDHIGDAKMLLGGKGSALVKMAKTGMNVPPGFTFTTAVCNTYRTIKGDELPAFLDTLMVEASNSMMWLADQFGYVPLVSVRSGAPVSMPGMMDTILNVGLHDAILNEWTERIGERATIDSYRRLIQMLGSTAYGIDMGKFDFQLASIKKAAGVENDADLKVHHLYDLVVRYKVVFKENVGFDFPQKPGEQLRAAIKAVFSSWMNERAIEYRKINKIDDAMGTAVTVQAMVFGNMGDDSGTGVLFTRDPLTGEAEVMGEFLQNAQGEDVVAGIRTPVNIHKMEALGGVWLDIYSEIEKICEDLEVAYKDMVDIEFTVQQGKLFILQSRAGKRSARAAFKIAHDLVEEKVIGWPEALKRVTREQYKVMRRPSIDPKFKKAPSLVGLPACPGVVTGKAVFSAADAINCKTACILVTHETTPDDIAGMNAALGILTQTGGATSHAAVVARAMDKACVVGATALDFKALEKMKDLEVTIDGSTGRVWFNTKVPVVDASNDPSLAAFETQALKKLGVDELVTLDTASGRPQQIAVAHWWGHKDLFDSVLDNLAAAPDKSRFSINLLSPKEILGEDPLDKCFGPEGQGHGSDPEFRDYMKARLTERAAELAGVGLVTDEEFGLFYTKPKKRALPVEAAVFRVLA